jgi:PIN domain nuclease of toxin-antitoxin system
MRLLLDTHAFLWFIAGDRRLPETWRAAIQDPENEVFLSAVSLWETIVKHQLGKLPLPEPPASYLPRQRDRHRIASLALDEPSVARLADLPALHRDPFDRMIICQALQNGLSIATLDDAIMGYDVPILRR